MRCSATIAGMALLAGLAWGGCYSRSSDHSAPEPAPPVDSTTCGYCDTTMGQQPSPSDTTAVRGPTDTIQRIEPGDTSTRSPDFPPDTVAAALPQFPWPPPDPTSRYPIPDRLLPIGPTTTLGDAYDSLNKALYRAGVEEKSVYGRGDNGFVVVARVESINDDGKARPGAQRWQAVPPKKSFSLSSYLDQLFRASPGRYRVIVFVVTRAPVVTGDKPATKNEMELALKKGAGNLTGDYRVRPASGAHCEALIYEFFRASAASQPRLVGQSSITPVQHITGAGLWSPEDLKP
jgi:hypothetical protein